MPERSIASEPEYLNKYLGIRKEKSPDGSSIEVLLVCSGSDDLVVFNVIRATQKIHGGLYLFFEPFDGVGNRVGKIIGGDE